MKYPAPSDLGLSAYGRINYPAAEQRGILKSIERPKGRGLVCLRQDRTLVRLLPAFGWLAD
ncbi:MAG TPA: hypothetical protein PK874_07005 [Desulfobacteraceae bacterium]|nr:hypothetical protein [Desulfobacteraceae bacterium]HPJ66230.1 hypothetical protein [Desulfobacteraceae bacterium]